MNKNIYYIYPLIYLLSGIIMLIFPSNISDTICYFIGSVIIIYGIISLITYSKVEEDNFFNKILLIISLACIVFGIFMIAKPKTFVSIIPFTAGIFIFVESISKLKEAIRLKKDGYKNWWIVLLFFIELLIFALILLINPFKVIEVTIRFIGLIFIINALSSIWQLISTKIAI